MIFSDEVDFVTFVYEEIMHTIFTLRGNSAY